MITDYGSALARTLRLKCDIVLPEATKLLPEQALDVFYGKGLLPTFINESDDGSLVLEYHHKDLYWLIEFWLDGDIVLLFEEASLTSTWDLQPEIFADKLRYVLLHIPKQAMKHEAAI